MLGCYGKGKADKFAEICAGVVLAGETSVASAVLHGDWVSSHDRLAATGPETHSGGIGSAYPWISRLFRSFGRLRANASVKHAVQAEWYLDVSAHRSRSARSCFLPRSDHPRRALIERRAGPRTLVLLLLRWPGIG